MSRRHALLIGIDEYPLLTDWNQLEGCVNDIELMAATLQQHHRFEPSDCTLLRNSQATRQRILIELEGLCDRATRDDLVLVHFSGHGSQIVDQEGDEADGLDETLVPWDSGRAPHPNRDISDDEIHLWLTRLNQTTHHVVLIFDCCHAGTIVRGEQYRVRRAPPDLRALRPPLERPPTWRGLQSKAGSAELQGYVLLAACRDWQNAFELPVVREPRRVHGLLTYFLVRELESQQANIVNATITYVDLVERIGRAIAQLLPDQQPQAEGARHRRFFSCEQVVPEPFLTVAGKSAGEVRMSGGAVHGVEVGSQWTLCPSGTKSHRPVTASCAEMRSTQVEVSAVGAIESTGRWLNGSLTTQATAGGRAFPTAGWPGERLSVAIVNGKLPSAQLDEIRQLIRASPYLDLVRHRRPAGAQVSLAASPEDDLRLSWRVCDPAGRLLIPVIYCGTGSDNDSTRNLLLSQLETLATCRRVSALCNKHLSNNRQHGRSRSGLVGTLNLQCSVLADGGWQTVDLEQTQPAIFQNGQRLSFELSHSFHSSIHVYLLSLGIDAAVEQIYPHLGANEALAPGITVAIGKRTGDELLLRLPDTYPFDLETEPEPAMEQVKLIATTREIDLGPLLQPGFSLARQSADRQSEASDSLGLAGLFQNFASTVDWTTLTRRYVISPALG